MRNDKLQLTTTEVADEPDYSSRTYLLTAAERIFYLEGLAPAIGKRYHVSFKVRLADVIEAEIWESLQTKRIVKKHLDFVLTTPRTMRIAAAVELNDKTHELPERKYRDQFLAKALGGAGIPFIAFPAASKYDRTSVRQKIREQIQSFRETVQAAETLDISRMIECSCMLVENNYTNRIQLFFQRKPKSHVLTLLYQHSFSWNQVNLAWERHRDEFALRAARSIRYEAQKVAHEELLLKTA